MNKPGGCPSFVVMDTNKRKNVLVTQSARKAAAALEKGRRIEIWRDGSMLMKVLSYEEGLMRDYIEAEKEYIAEKQRRHEERNARRR